MSDRTGADRGGRLEQKGKVAEGGRAGVAQGGLVKYLDMGADISEDGRHRYWLSRRLSMGERAVLFVGLNPSTADASQDDPTIRRCVGFARAWGFDWLYMGNVNAYRSTDPKALKSLADIEAVGPLNKEALMWMAQKSDLVVVAWGSNPLNRYAQNLADWLVTLGQTRCLGQNKDGAPKHPLYLPKNAALEYLQSPVRPS